MALVELKIPTAPYEAGATKYLEANVKTFEDIRIAVAGFEAIGMTPPVGTKWLKQIVDAKLLANPRVRVKNREKAKVHIGSKVPVITTTSTANVGVSSSVSYLDVGLKLDVEPNIYLRDEVAIKVHLARHGVDVVQEGQRYGAEGNGPSIYVTDPDGNVVELKGPPA